GVNCAETNDDVSVSDGRPPCLAVDVANQRGGQIRVYVDYTIYDQVTLSNGSRYRMRVPGLNRIEDATDPALYKYAFWDACGMPLITGGHEGDPDYHYDFTIDEPKRSEDPDNDGIPLSCDNANQFYNPGQEDTDGDGIGDVYDLCLTVPSSSDDTADSDRDGVGNNCDTCTRAPKNYNDGAEEAGVPFEYRVRNIPWQIDTDGDGIGDVCDNCITRANCGDFNGDNPWSVGDTIDVLDSNACQTDNDGTPKIGDACIEDGNPIEDAGSAGPVGFAATDDFDQDGLTNETDFCPRQRPQEIATCAGPDDCGSGVCTNGVCNHVDTDGDQVGDICDTCPVDANPNQIFDGSAQEDDSDEDFVGKICETNPECASNRDPKPYGLYDVSVNGQCCVIQFDPDVGLLDPDCNVLSTDCTGVENCTQLPDVVLEREGMTTLPTGCEAALAAAGYEPGEQASKIVIPEDPSQEDLADAWSNLCFLPQRDQDFDGVGDACELDKKCKFAHDPNNEPYLDENGKLWPDLGKYCFGEYDPEMNKCGEDEEGETEGETDTDGDTDTDTGTTG
ncbi:MAG: thrombospondin type 3 repeat-containing protein, partial [Nannocystaceae bacterium]